MQKRKGISLIVLVITIIVMIILAGAIILSLNNAGIIVKANQAVEKTNINQVRTLAELKWSEAYLDEKVNTDEEYSETVKNALQQEGIDISKYVIVVTKEGVEVIDGWIQDGLTVRKGNVVLNVGDDIVYDETKEGTVTVPKDVSWKILGASDKGELLILSTTGVANLQLEKPGATITDLQQAWLTAKQQLDDLCAPYVYGKSAINSRSIKIDDIDKITGYDKTKFGEGTLGEYNAQVVVKYNGTNNPYYELSDELKGDFTSTHNIFSYYNENKFVDLDPTKGTSGEVITTITNKIYTYPIELAATSKAYTLINEVATYWLANLVYGVTDVTIVYQINVVNGGRVMSTPLLGANGGIPKKNYNFNVRAVVSLASSVQLTGSSASGWSY